MASIVEEIRSVLGMIKEDRNKWRSIREKYGRGAQRKRSMRNEILSILQEYPEGLTAYELREKLGMPSHTAYVYELLYPMEYEKKLYLTPCRDENGRPVRFVYTLQPLQKDIPTVW